MKILKICLNRMFIFGVLILLQVLWLGFFTNDTGIFFIFY